MQFFSKLGNNMKFLKWKNIFLDTVSNKNKIFKKNVVFFLLTVVHAKLFKLAKNETSMIYSYLKKK